MTGPSHPTAATGPVLFAYDGSELAGSAIDQAARLLAPGRDALVVCVWQPADVGFEPVNDRPFDADEATEVRRAAADTAAHGAALAGKAGFRPESLAIEGAPTWRAIVDTAGDHRASLIVLGSHRRTGVAKHLIGSVASAVVAHSAISVFVARQPA